MSTDGLQPPQIHFEDGVPVSARYEDIYFSRAGGLAETRGIFIQQNRLTERWAAAGAGSGFTIGELGFGTGLNFCATVAAFRAQPTGPRRLRYFSCEAHPLSREQLHQALEVYRRELPEEIAALMAIYPPAVGGVHALRLALPPTKLASKSAECTVELILLMGPAQAMFAALDAPANPERGVQAWYLDGFAPARNPEMWTAALFAELRRLSAPGATFATYTAAGAVRRALSETGFAVEKIPGFGHKREMLRGQLDSSGPSAREGHSDGASRRIMIIGAGLAGTAAADACLARGHSVVLIEREERIASQASGNPLGIAAPAIQAARTPLDRLSTSGLLYLRSRLARTPEKSSAGVVYLAHSPALIQRFAKFHARTACTDFAQAMTADQIAELLGTACAHGGCYFPEALVLSPPELAAHFISEYGSDSSAQAGPARLELQLETRALTLRPRPEGGWSLDLTGGRESIASGDHVIIASAHDARNFEQMAAVPLRPVRGQTCGLPEYRGRVALCYDGYVTPARGAVPAQLGASFEEWNENPTVQAEQNAQLVARLQAVAPDAISSETAAQAPGLSARVAFRTATPDRLPVIGALPIPADCEAAAHGSGVYAHTALGSRGLVFAGIGAECLAAAIDGEIVPIERDVWRAVRPDRFAERAARRTQDPDSAG